MALFDQLPAAHLFVLVAALTVIGAALVVVVWDAVGRWWGRRSLRRELDRERAESARLLEQRRASLDLAVRAGTDVGRVPRVSDHHPRVDRVHGRAQ